jgi:nicotinamidase-related amidase
VILSFILLNSFSIAQDGDKNYVLVIMDMQDGILASNPFITASKNVKLKKKLLEEQLKLIKLAKKNNIPIVLTEIKDLDNQMPGIQYGETIPEIKKELLNYKNMTTYIREEIPFFKNNNLPKVFNKSELTDVIILGGNGATTIQDFVQGATERKLKVTYFAPAIAELRNTVITTPYFLDESIFKDNNFVKIVNENEISKAFFNISYNCNKHFEL